MTLSLAVVATLLLGFLIGVIPSVLEGFKKSLEARLKLPVSGAEPLTQAFYFSWLPAMPIAGVLLDHIPNRQLIFVGQIALILGFTWLALARQSVTFVPNAILVGAAYSVVTVGAVRLMTVAFFPVRGPDNMLGIASLNIGFVTVGLGAVAGAWGAWLLDRWWGFRQGLLIFSVILLLPAALTAFCDSSSFPRPNPNAKPWGEIVTNFHMLLLAGVLLLYFAMENCLEYWPEAFLKEIDFQPRGMQITVVIFWIAFATTRAAAAWWVYHHPSHGLPLTIFLLIASGCVLGNLAGGYNLGSSTLGFWLAGACYGPVLPGILGLAIDFYHPSSLPASALGALLAMSGLDTLAVRPLMNRFVKGRAARTVMRIPTVLAFLIAAPLLYLALMRG